MVGGGKERAADCAGRLSRSEKAGRFHRPAKTRGTRASSFSVSARHSDGG